MGKQVSNRRVTLKDIYRYYVADGGTLDRTTYKNICQDFNIHIMNAIIYDAEIFDMGYDLSTISILRIKRNYKNPAVDWKASKEYRKELVEEGKELYDSEKGKGVKWLIYHDSDWYVRFYWKKKYARVKNKTAYSFVATRGTKGNKTKLKNHLAESDINYIKYEKARKE
jgi:hypothetical protein